MFRPGLLPFDALAVEAWDVIFYGYEPKGWWDHLSPPECRHCAAYGYVVRANVWVLVNTAWRGAPILVASDAERADIEQFVLADATARLGRMRGSVTRNRPRALVTCATMVADVIGFSTRALRPIELYRDLLADPATEVVHELGTESTRNA